MNVSSRLLHYGKSALLTLALLYSLLAGLRTVTDPDTGWQLASGRYIVQHHQIPSTDVLSYTAHGREWIYPPLAEIVLYGLYALGGFAALSWLNSFGCVATVSCAFYAESSVAAIALAILAVPRIAYRTAPRADMFSTVLFAALLALLWRHFRSRRAPLWLVPVIMLIWVNAHPGFIAGLALLALYVTLEVLEFPFSDRSAAAAARLRRAAPWLLAAIPVTILNRWGWKIYAGVFQQEQSLGVHENLIAEWRRTPISLDTVSQALDWRNPNSGFWWLLAAAVVAAIVALKRKQFGVAALLLGCSYLALHNLRFQGLFAVVAIVIAAPYFSGWFDRPAGVKPRVKRERLGPTPEKNRFNPSWATASILLVCTFLVGIRACDLIFERAYIAAGEPALFGTGLSSRYPKHAAEFIMRERLPGNIFHEYNLGGYLSFRLGPQYPDYVDGRALPFEDVMFEQRNIMRQPPDSSDWQQEADQRGINTLIFSLARYWGLGSNHVKQFCGSRAWKPVYLDEEAVVFVRNVPENATLISRLGIDCGTVKFEPPAALEADKSFRGRAELFNFYANSGSALYNLARNTEAAAELDHALQMFPEEPYLHHTRGQLYEASRQFQDAEREYLLSAHLEPTEANWYSLGMLYFSQGRYAEAVKAVWHAAEISVRPSEYYTLLARLYLASNQPQEALGALDLAIEQSDHEPPDVKPAIEEQVAEERAQVWSKVGDLQRAVGFQQQALTYKPSNPQLWTALADLYAASGQGQLEQQARQRAQELSQPER